MSAIADDHVPFGDVARDQLGMQCQYASRYVSGVGNAPDLAHGLRVEGSTADYHSLTIHKDDVAELVLRVKRYQHDRGIHHWPELDAS